MSRWLSNATKAIARSFRPRAADGAAPSSGPKARSDRIEVENRNAGSRAWRRGRAPDDINKQIQGYASETSVNIGDSIDFHVTVDSEQEFTIEIYRLGWYGGEGSRHMKTSPVLHGKRQPAPTLDQQTGMITCAWSPSWTLHVPTDWTSGLYVASFVTGDRRAAAPFVIRDDHRDAALCVVIPFTTYQAYNQWPTDGKIGKSLYYGFPPTAENEPPRFANDPGTRANKVSFDRPFEQGGIPSQADYDFDSIAWLEKEGYDVTYCTSIDLHRGRIDPKRFAGLIFSGHDEYWSRKMREVPEKALECGTSLVFFGANAIYWHIRFEQSADGRPDRVLVCYKTSPDPEAEPGEATTKWRTSSPGPRKAEQRLLGIQYKAVVPEPVPLVVKNSDHWMWAGCGVQDGDEVDRLVAIEADNFDPRYPKPNGVQTLLAESPYTMANGVDTVHHTSIYETDTGAVVFVAGTFYWPYGLSEEGYVDKRIQLATANLLQRILNGPAS